MSQIPWHLIQDRHLRAHLVVGAIAQPDAPGADELTEAQLALRHLANEQKPTGDYAATLVRDAGRPEVHFAFRDEGDARKFAAAVKAEAIGSHPGQAWELGHGKGDRRRQTASAFLHDEGILTASMRRAESTFCLQCRRACGHCRTRAG
jgi:hypothetical protein